MLDPSLINVTISPSILPHDQWCCIQFEKSVNQVLYTSWLKFQKNYESIEKQWSIQRFQSRPMETKNLIRIDNPISNTHKKKKRVPERQKQFSTMDHSEEISIKNFYRWNVWLKKFQITSFEELINTGFSYESHRYIIMHAEAKWEHADGGA